MKNSIVIAAGLAFAASASAQLNPVISTVELSEQLGEVTVLDIQRSAEDFAQAHIPGSVHLPYGNFRGPKNNPGQVPALTQLAEALGAKGLNKDDAIVVAHLGRTSTDFGAAARVYWTLKSVGFENLAVLNGGFNAYQSQGLELTDQATQISPSTLALAFDDTWYASTAYIEDQIESGDSVPLLDSRLESFYEGKRWHGAAKRPGILPGADNFAFTAFFDDGSTLLKPANEVNEIVASNNLGNAQTVSYCNTGHWAATNWFVLSEVAGVEDVKLYAESMVEWSNQGLAMENAPNALQFALLKSKKWLDALGN